MSYLREKDYKNKERERERPNLKTGEGKKNREVLIDWKRNEKRKGNLGV